ncbi:YesL family protein [Salipaludibacillus sp. CF4.18]|uniref:YesL family protein n=1 Tax=Salipaludibacillus sp. CF4.18 TaxID=3373081 RepID=UPI003EE6048D
MRGFYQVSEWVTKFAVVNMLWLVCNAPIILIMMNLYVVKFQGLLLISSLLIAALSPFLLFPSTAAMFSSVRDWILKNDNQSLWRSYWYYFKENYKRSMFMGIILTVAWAILIGDIYYFHQESTILMFTFIALGVLLFVYTINIFCVMAHYDLKITNLLKRAFLFTVGSPLLSVIIVISSAIVIYVSANSLRFLIPFFSGSLITFICFSTFYKVYEKFSISKPE